MRAPAPTRSRRGSASVRLRGSGSGSDPAPADTTDGERCRALKLYWRSHYKMLVAARLLLLAVHACGAAAAASNEGGGGSLPPRPSLLALDFAVSVSYSSHSTGDPAANWQLPPGSGGGRAGFPGSRNPTGPNGPIVTLDAAVQSFAFRSKDFAVSTTNLQQVCPGHQWEDRPCPMAAGSSGRVDSGNIAGGNTTQRVTTVTLPEYINYPVGS